MRQPPAGTFNGVLRRALRFGSKADPVQLAVLVDEITASKAPVHDGERAERTDDADPRSARDQDPVEQDPAQKRDEPEDSFDIGEAGAVGRIAQPACFSVGRYVGEDRG